MKAFTIAIIILVIGLGTFFYFKEPPQVAIEPTPTPLAEEKLNGNPTDFSYAGRIVFPNPSNAPQPTLSFSYTDSEGTAATTILLMDAMSVCASQTGATHCIAMSVTFDKVFEGKQAIVEGIRQGADVLVRKMYILAEGEPALVPGTQSVFISWPQARDFIRSCAPTMIMQTHKLDVYLTMQDGSQLRAVEPLMDEVFKVFDEVKDTCGNIAIATE